MPARSISVVLLSLLAVACAANPRTDSAVTLPYAGTIYSEHDEGIVVPRVLRRVDPDFPNTALQDELQGTVFMEVVVLPDGTVGEVTVTGSLRSDLDEEAIETIRQWLFEPPTRFGVPVALSSHVEMDFVPR